MKRKLTIFHHKKLFGIRDQSWIAVSYLESQKTPIAVTKNKSYYIQCLFLLIQSNRFRITVTISQTQLLTTLSWVKWYQTIDAIIFFVQDMYSKNFNVFFLLACLFPMWKYLFWIMEKIKIFYYHIREEVVASNRTPHGTNAMISHTMENCSKFKDRLI